MKNFYFLVILFLSFTIYPMIHHYNDENGKPVVCHSIGLNINSSFANLGKKKLAQKLYCDNYIFNLGTNFTFKEPLYKDNRQPVYSHNTVVFLKESSSELMFVLKCYDEEDEDKDLAIREALGSSVGASVGIPINKVKIIPKSMDFFGKSDCFDYPCVATLHTCVPGIEISKLSCPFGLDLSSGIDVLYGNDKKYHPDLCDLLALDIFVSNGDRSPRNFTFDEKQNRYYGFDMDRSYFGKVLESFTVLNFLKKILSNEKRVKTLDQEEKNALVRMNWRLKMLASCYSNQKIYDLWMKKANEAEYEYTKADQEKIKKRISKDKMYVKEIITLIDQINFAN